MLAFLYLLAEKISCSAMFSKKMKDFAIVGNLRFIGRRKILLSFVEHETIL